MCLVKRYVVTTLRIAVVGGVYEEFMVLQLRFCEIGDFLCMKDFTFVIQRKLK